MPQIPGLPIDAPVEKPHASPAEFGSVGNAIAGLGEETEQLAAGNAAFAGHLIEAQRYLKAKQAEIAYDRVLNQVHADLAKETTPEGVQAVYDHAKGELQNTLAPFESDRVLSRELAIFGQQQDVQLQNTVNGRKATLIQKGDEASNEVLYGKSLQEAINTKAAGGDASVSRQQLRSKLDASVYMMGTMTPQQADAIMQRFDKDYQKGTILTQINSPSQATRQDVIGQLSKGGGTLDHSELSSEELSQLRTHAIDTDHSLTEKEEAGNLNGALNVKAEAFSSPEFKNSDGTPNYEARENALESGEWLVAHGIVTPDGKPNRVMADKMLEDDAKQWQMHQKVQRDKDEAVLEKYSPMLYDPAHPLSIAQIEKLPQTDGASSRAVNQLKTALFQEQRNARAERREERSLGLAERQQRRQELEDKSISTSLSLTDRMSNGDVLDYNRDILEPISKGQMTEADGAKVWHMYKDSDQYPEIQEGVGIIASTFKSLEATPENNRKAMDARDAFLKTVKEKNLHGADISIEAQRIAEQNGKAQTGNVITNFFHNLATGNIGPYASPLVSTPQSTPSTVSQFMAVPNPKGMVESGNLPIQNRPVIQNDDGSRSTEFSISMHDNRDGSEVLVPTVVNGKFLTPDGKKPPEGSTAEKTMFKAAWQHYKDTGENLGKFKTPSDANAYAKQLHERQDSRISPTSSAPKDGDTKTNSSGDKVVFRYGKWVAE